MTTRALVIYKRTSLERYGQSDTRIRKLIEDGVASVANLRLAHDAHYRSLDRAKDAMKRLGVDATFQHDVNLQGKFDLVVTIGGDGTLLWASHSVGADTPMLAVNSSPETSVGYFTAGDGAHVESLLERALNGKLAPTRLTRMQVRVDGEVIASRILNDILFCHSVPAAASRYLLTAVETKLTEEHVSSGIWVGPAAGSTAAQRSAGGRVLPIGSKKIQWVVREPYRPGDIKLRLVKGILRNGETLSIVSKIRDGRLYLDGAQRMVEVDIGHQVDLTQSEEPLTLLGLRSRGR